ncbi:MAG: hypothetical protein AB7V18_17085 [Pyrinomonadaceae bacterium]
MERKARVAFYIGAVFLFLLGAIHSLAHFSGVPAGLDAEQQRAMDLATTIRFAMPTGEMRTIIDIQNAFSLYFVIFPITLAVVLWLTVRKLPDPRPVLLVAAFAMFASAAVTYIYAILPPFIMFVIAGLAFVASATLSGRNGR